VKHTQHKGFGGKMVEKAEEIAKQNNYSKIAVISGMGVVDYYAKFGFKHNGYFLVKHFNHVNQIISIHPLNTFMRNKKLRISLTDIPSDISYDDYLSPQYYNSKNKKYNYMKFTDKTTDNISIYLFLVYFTFAFIISFILLFKITYI
jgi:hypothetical protein